MLMSAVIGCKLGKLDWNKTQRQNAFYHFFFIFTIFLVSGEHWNDMCILAFIDIHENNISLLSHENMASHPCG